MKCSDNHTFENWAKTLRFSPKRFCQPESIDDVVSIVREARGKGQVRVQGAEHSHSWSQFTLTNDTLVNLDKLNHALIADVTKAKFTVQAGVRLKDLVKMLANDNLGLRNTGSILEQSLAGAISTGTHGTGLGLGNLATQIVALKLVTGTGDVLEIDETKLQLLRAARVSVGALGIIVEATIQCVPDYKLESSTYWCRFEDMIDIIPALNKENDRVRLWYFPKTLFGIKQNVIISTMNKPNTPRGVLGTFQNMTGTPGNMLGASSLPLDLGVLFDAIQQLAVDPTHSVLLSRFTDNYIRVLTLPLIPILHRECEYAIPVERTRDALIELKQILEEGDFATTLPIEVRFVAADDTLLSPANGRDVCYIGANTQGNANEVFQRVEPLMKTFGGRPHWGKHFTMTRDEIAHMYPGTYEDFRKLRATLDPDNVFANSLVRQLFS